MEHVRPHDDSSVRSLALTHACHSVSEGKQGAAHRQNGARASHSMGREEAPHPGNMLKLLPQKLPGFSSHRDMRSTELGCCDATAMARASLKSVSLRKEAGETAQQDAGVTSRRRGGTR